MRPLSLALAALLVSGCATLAPPQEIHTRTNPQAIALDARTHTLYTADQVDNTISVIDASSCNASVTVGCRTRPSSAAVRAAGGIAVDQRRQREKHHLVADLPLPFDSTPYAMPLWLAEVNGK